MDRGLSKKRRLEYPLPPRHHQYHNSRIDSGIHRQHPQQPHPHPQENLPDDGNKNSHLHSGGQSSAAGYASRIETLLRSIGSKILLLRTDTTTATTTISDSNDNHYHKAVADADAVVETAVTDHFEELLALFQEMVEWMNRHNNDNHNNAVAALQQQSSNNGLNGKISREKNDGDNRCKKNENDERNLGCWRLHMLKPAFRQAHSMILLVLMKILKSAPTLSSSHYSCPATSATAASTHKDDSGGNMCSSSRIFSIKVLCHCLVTLYRLLETATTVSANTNADSISSVLILGLLTEDECAEAIECLRKLHFFFFYNRNSTTVVVGVITDLLEQALMQLKTGLQQRQISHDVERITVPAKHVMAASTAVVAAATTTTTTTTKTVANSNEYTKIDGEEEEKKKDKDDDTDDRISKIRSARATPDVRGSQKRKGYNDRLDDSVHETTTDRHDTSSKKYYFQQGQQQQSQIVPATSSSVEVELLGRTARTAIMQFFGNNSDEDGDKAENGKCGRYFVLAADADEKEAACRQAIDNLLLTTMEVMNSSTPCTSGNSLSSSAKEAGHSGATQSSSSSQKKKQYSTDTVRNIARTMTSIILLLKEKQQLLHQLHGNGDESNVNANRDRDNRFHVANVDKGADAMMTRTISKQAAVLNWKCMAGLIMCYRRITSNCSTAVGKEKGSLRPEPFLSFCEYCHITSTDELKQLISFIVANILLDTSPPSPASIAAFPSQLDYFLGTRDNSLAKNDCGDGNNNYGLENDPTTTEGIALGAAYLLLHIMENNFSEMGWSLPPSLRSSLTNRSKTTANPLNQSNKNSAQTIISVKDCMGIISVLLLQCQHAAVVHAASDRLCNTFLQLQYNISKKQPTPQATNIIENSSTLIFGSSNSYHESNKQSLDKDSRNNILLDIVRDKCATVLLALCQVLDSSFSFDATKTLILTYFYQVMSSELNSTLTRHFLTRRPEFLQAVLNHALAALTESAEEAAHNQTSLMSRNNSRMAIEILLQLSHNVANRRILARHVGILPCLIRYTRGFYRHHHGDVERLEERREFLKRHILMVAETL